MRAMQRGGIVSGRSRIAVALIIFALLAFTTIRTSPISAGIGPGSSLSDSTPKQRHFLDEDFVSTSPVLVELAVAPVNYDNVVPTEFNELPPDHFFGRYFNLPPPTA
jgi:hypothetical protein